MIVLPDKSAVVLDIETTEVALADARGGFPQPIEVAGCQIDCEYQVVGEFSTLVRPDPAEEFTEYCQLFTGISPDELAAAPSWREVWRDFAEFTQFNGRRLISYGAYFDYPVLRTAYRRVSVGWPHAFPMVDALSMVYRVAGEYGFRIPRWSLKSCCERFGIEPEKKHRALGGARRAVAVMRAISTLNQEEMELL